MPKLQYRKPVTPTSKADFVKVLIASYNEDYGVSKSDVRQMSIQSLRKLYAQVASRNYLKLSGKSFKEIYKKENTNDKRD